MKELDPTNIQRFRIYFRVRQRNHYALELQENYSPPSQEKKLDKVKIIIIATAMNFSEYNFKTPKSLTYSYYQLLLRLSQ